MKQQVLGRIAGDRELGCYHQVGTVGLGLLDRLRQALDVAVEVADHGIELGGGDSDDRHGLHRTGTTAPGRTGTVAG